MKKGLESDKTSKVEIRVLYADTDHGGVVYYASYLRWFEFGRTEHFRSAGVTYASLENSGILCPVAELQCKYHQSAKYDEILSIFTWIERLKRCSITFGYKILRESDQSLIVTGQTKHGFIDRNFKCIRPPRQIYAALHSFVQTEEELNR